MASILEGACPNEVYAIKVTNHNEAYKSRAEKEEHLKNLSLELEIMQTLQGCPFIVKLYGNVF